MSEKISKEGEDELEGRISQSVLKKVIAYLNFVEKGGNKWVERLEKINRQKEKISQKKSKSKSNKSKKKGEQRPNVPKRYFDKESGPLKRRDMKEKGPHKKAKYNTHGKTPSNE
jgi:hypothetical protein